MARARAPNDKGKKQNSSVARGCIFCGGPNLSGEHFWDEWMHPLLPGNDTQQSFEISLIGNWVNSSIVHSKNREGPIKKKKIKGPCVNCNNGWMNLLSEQKARPIITPLICGTPTPLDELAQDIIAKYVVMKSMVSDIAGKNHCFNERERKDFFEIQKIPDDIIINIFRYKWDFDEIAQHNKEYNTVFDGIKITSMFNFTFRFGYVFIQILRFRFFSLASAENTIFPYQGRDIKWGDVSLTQYGAFRFQHCLEELTSGLPGINRGGFKYRLPFAID